MADFPPTFVSQWYQQRADDGTVIEVELGFFPALVSVIVQVHDGSGWKDMYSHVSPAKSAWDDLDRRGENIYYITSHSVRIVPWAGGSGNNLFDGPDGWRRFRVYAWRGATL